MWKPAWKFAIHVVLSSVLFALIFVVALLLDFGAKELKESASPSEYLIWLLTGAKYIVATVDVVVYVSLVITMSVEFLRELWWPNHEKNN